MILVVSGRRQLLERVLADGARPIVLVALSKTALDGLSLPPEVRIERIARNRFSFMAGFGIRNRLPRKMPVAFLAARPSAYGYDNVLGFALMLAGPRQRVTVLSPGGSSALGWSEWFSRRLSRRVRDVVAVLVACLFWPIVRFVIKSDRCA